MFIYSVRASTVKMGVLVLLLGVLIATLAFSGPSAAVSAWGTNTSVDFGGVKTKENRVEFMKNLGIEVDEGSEESQAFRMPENFDRVILGYNELQKKQGLDLSKYANKKVTRYTYKVTNYDFEGDVYANLFVYRSKIVACDICSADPEGFVTPMTLVSRDNLK